MKWTVMKMKRRRRNSKRKMIDCYHYLLLTVKLNLFETYRKISMISVMTIESVFLIEVCNRPSIIVKTGLYLVFILSKSIFTRHWL